MTSSRHQPVVDSRNATLESQPVVLLTSASLNNKGDALMLRAVVNRLGDGFRYAIPSNVAAVSPRAAAPFLVCLTSDRPGSSSKRKAFNAVVGAAHSLSAAVPPRLRKSLRLVRDSDVDVCIDVSGYCYGDHWGEELLGRAVRQYRRLGERGVPVILMPKTWGPFERIQPSLVNALIDSCDLAFARDKTSLDHLQRCLDERNRAKVSFAPDYTHEVVGAHEPRFADENTFYIIPSYRVVDSGALPKDRYVRLLGLARQRITDAGGRARLLIHETPSDLAFLEHAHVMGFPAGEAVMEPDPTEVKRIIAGCTGVVTSRLHGLYNALNSGVPGVTIPWSFKYQEALSHYDCGELLVDMSRPEESLVEKIELLTSAPDRARLAAAMTRKAAEIQSQIDAMWDRIGAVLSVLDRRSSTPGVARTVTKA